jgi:hypothetical protein
MLTYAADNEMLQALSHAAVAIMPEFAAQVA